MPSWPKCIHQWDAPETCPACLAVYKQRRIEELEAERDAARADLEESLALLRDWSERTEKYAKVMDMASGATPKKIRAFLSKHQPSQK